MKTIYASTISLKKRKTLKTTALQQYFRKNPKEYKTRLDYIFRIP
jgi:hypothetical protein